MSTTIRSLIILGKRQMNTLVMTRKAIGRKYASRLPVPWAIYHVHHLVRTAHPRRLKPAGKENVSFYTTYENKNEKNWKKPLEKHMQQHGVGECSMSVTSLYHSHQHPPENHISTIKNIIPFSVPSPVTRSVTQIRPNLWTPNWTCDPHTGQPQHPVLRHRQVTNSVKSVDSRTFSAPVTLEQEYLPSHHVL